jgi:hypothetical protein
LVEGTDVVPLLLRRITMAIRAFFEGNPYKFWSYGAEGTMHVGFAHDLPDHDGLFEANTPNDVCECKTWDGFVWMWLSMGGDVVLHMINDEFCEYERQQFIEDVRSECKSGAAINFHRIEGRLYDMQVILLPHIEPDKLFGLMHMLYDTDSNEWWDDDKRTDYITDDVDEIIAM